MTSVEWAAVIRAASRAAARLASGAPQLMTSRCAPRKTRRTNNQHARDWKKFAGAAAGFDQDNGVLCLKPLIARVPGHW